jgi:hypothetical protein
MNAYASEKNQISRSIERINNLKHDYKYMEDEIKERERDAENYLQELPTLMSSMFDHLEKLVETQEEAFKNDIADVVQKQQLAIKIDIHNKAPNFTQRLSNRYMQL